MHTHTPIEGQRVRKRRDESLRDGAELGECAVPPRADSAPHAAVVAEVGLPPLAEVARVAVPKPGATVIFPFCMNHLTDAPARIDGHSVAGLELFDAFPDRLHGADKLVTESDRVRARRAELALVEGHS